MIRNTVHLLFLGAVAAVLLCAVPVVAGTECSDPETVHEVELTPELAVELGLPETIETAVAEPIPLCPANETLQVCKVTDPCTSQTFRDATCCPEETRGVCLIGITRDGCITGVHAVCLGIVSL